MKKIILLISFLGLLAGCGDNKKSENPPTVSVEQRSGIFTDGVISGAYYKTSSGIEGYTNADGKYNYNQGDTVTFSIGGIQLGNPVTASDRTTPLELSDNNNIRTNIMILLQSLDDDGNHDNGINIAETTHNLLNAQDFDLDQSPVAFASNSSLITAVNTIEPNRTPVSPETALNNFKEAFLKDITGIWVPNSAESEEEMLIISIRADGTYLIGEVGEEDDYRFNGIEAGLISWNPLTTEISVSIEPENDTNGEWGLSNPLDNVPFKLNYDGTNLLINESDEIHSFKRIEHQPNQIIGAWRYPETNQIYAFFSNNRYFIADSSTGLEGLNCGRSGVEYGEFSYENNQLKATKLIIDTNGCVGFSSTFNANTSYTIQVNNNVMSLKGGGERIYTLNRVEGYEAPIN